MSTVGIYFKEQYDSTEIRRKAGEVARATGIGTGPDDILAAVVYGTATIKVVEPAESTGQLATIQLDTLLEMSANLLNDEAGEFAAELRSRAQAIRAVGF